MTTTPPPLSNIDPEKFLVLLAEFRAALDCGVRHYNSAGQLLLTVPEIVDAITDGGLRVEAAPFGDPTQALAAAEDRYLHSETLKALATAERFVAEVNAQLPRESDAMDYWQAIEHVVDRWRRLAKDAHDAALRQEGGPDGGTGNTAP